MQQILKTATDTQPHQALPEELQISADILQEDTLHALGENTAALLHELRGPLQAMRAHIQVLERKIGAQSEELTRNFTPIYRNIEYMCNMMDQFLRLSRFAEPCLNWLNLTDCVNDLLPLLRSMAVMRRVELSAELPTEFPACLGDEQQLKRLLFNLFANSLDACAGQEDARIIIRLTQEAEGLLLMVLDNGCGIAAEKLSTIWQPFYSSKTSGTGLGLPCCLNIAAQHHGNLTVISRVGEGSCFTLRLPLDSAEDGKPRPL